VVQITGQNTQTKGGDQSLSDKVENLEEGDKILFNDRKKPLTVEFIGRIEAKDEEVVSGMISGPQGAEYSIVQSAVNKECVTVRSRSLHGIHEQIQHLEVVQ